MRKIREMKQPGRFSSGWQRLWRTIFVGSFLALGIYPTFGQEYTKVISLKVEDVSLLDALKQVNVLSDNCVSYKREEVEKEKKRVTLDMKEVTVLEVVKACLSGTKLNCITQKNLILIVPGKSVGTGVGKLKGHHIVGVVVDAKKNPLPGVTVVWKGTTVGTSTNERGVFQITLPEDKGVLLFSFIGFKKEELSFTAPCDTLRVKMIEETAALDEVVITGMFNKPKESYTGAVTHITKQELADFKSRNLLSTIANIDPSFNIVENNKQGSNPNALPEINIRGMTNIPQIEELPSTGSIEDFQTEQRANLNTPLFIMDGFEISLERMMDLDEEDIESVTILKDASSTAIYGSRGSNGVVVITSVKPKSGKLRVSVRGSLNFEVPDLTSYNLLNAREKLELEVLAGHYEADRDRADYWLQKDALDNEYNMKLRNVERGVNTYWLSQPLRTGINGNYGLNLSGGDRAFRYSLSASYNMTKGVMKGSDRGNFNGTLTISYLYKNFSFSNSVSVGANRGNESMYGNFSSYADMNPYYSPYDDKGELVVTYPAAGGESKGPKNPLYDAFTSSYAYSSYVDLRNNTSVEWTPIESVKAGLRFGYSLNNRETHDYKSAKHTMFLQQFDPLTKGSYNYGISKSKNWNLALNFSWAKVYGDHSIFFGFNGTLSETKSDSYGFGVVGFMHDRFDYLSMGASYSGNNPSGSESTTRSIGVTANVNYNWKHSLFIDGSYRLDGASSFGPYSRFRPFYTVGAGWTASSWKVIREKAPWINTLRFKYNYGITGSLPFQVYDAITTFNYDTGVRYHGYLGASILGFGNPDLTWQYTYSHNIGMELTMLSGLISANVNFYRRLTEGSISNATLPPSHGYTSYKENQGDIKNEGYDFSVSLRVINDMQRRINWSVRGSFQSNRNVLVRLSAAMKEYSERIQARDVGNQNPAFLYREGESMSALYVVRSLGIDPATGKELFQKRNGTVSYKYDNNDKVPVGVSEPKITGNLSSTFRYKNFNFSVAFNLRLGGQKYNSTLVQKVENADILKNVDRRVFGGRWRGPDHYAKYKGLNEELTVGQSSRFVQDERTLKCGSVNMSYNWVSKWVKTTLKMSSISFNINTTDLFQISTVKLERGTSYPFARRISTQISFNF